MSGRETKVNDEKETYTMKDFYNPLIGMDYPDPDLIRVGASQTFAVRDIDNLFF